MTYATIEKFSMHECVKIKREAQVVNPSSGLAPQGDSELKIEGSDQNTEKEVKSKEDIPSPFEKLPDEIILKILSLLSFKSLGNCNQVSSRMKRIAGDTSLWEKVQSSGKVVPAGFVEQIVKSNVKSIEFHLCEVSPIKFDILMENSLDLKYMDIACCTGNDEFLSELVKCSKSLEYLNINESRSNLVFKCIENIAYLNNLKVLCLFMVELNFESVKRIIDRCTELNDIDIMETSLTQESIDYICTNLTPNALEIRLSNNEAKDKHIHSLVVRCKNLKHLDLCDTDITYKSVPWIVTALSNSLLTLGLTQNVANEIGLPSNISMEKLKIIFPLPLTNLKKLYFDDSESLGYWYEKGGIYHCDIHIEKFDKIFPKLTILGSSEYMEYDPFEHYCKKQKFKKVTCLPLRQHARHVAAPVAALPAINLPWQPWL
jgi:hypothetical protein